MKHIASMIVMTAALMAAAPAFAASDYLLELEGVKGEATATIEVASWSFGVCNAGQCSAIKSPRDAASGLATGKRQHQPVGATAAGEPASAERTVPTKGNWDLATGKGARTAGGVNVASGDVDGDGHADLAYVESQDTVSAFTLTYDKASPVLAKVCAGKHIAKATLSRGAESYTLSDATVACTGAGPVVMTFTGGQLKHNKTGHVTLMK
jgi:hypothetical protein